MRDYTIEARAVAGTGPWTPLCNITGNYLRRRVHSLPCASAPTPAPGPSPPPAPPAVAPGALVADLCAAHPGQLWSRDPKSGVVSTRTASGAKLCLGFDDHNITAFGGEGLAVVARPCTDHAIAWTLRPGDTDTGAVLLETSKPTPCLPTQVATPNGPPFAPTPSLRVPQPHSPALFASHWRTPRQTHSPSIHPP